MKKFLSILLFVLVGNFSLFAQEKITISSFSPEGTVKVIKQVKVNFSAQMVPFGNPRVKTDQFEINCPVEGKARWIDEKTYVYEFPNNLEAGIVCKFQLKADIKTLAGKEITGKKAFSFSTGGPAVLFTNPYEGGSVDEDQIFILKLDTEIKESSLENKLAFEIEGIKERVAAIVVKPSDAQDILKAEFGEKYKTEKLLLVKSKLRLPNKAKVSLIWAKGIESKSGVKTDEDRILSYSTRTAFTADFSCDRENKNAGCIPISNFYINFTSPIQKSDSKKITLESGGKKWKAKISGSTEEDSEEGTTYGIYFEGPFPEETKFKINIPDSLKDDAGRKLTNANKYPLEIKSDKYPPLAKFSGSFGIIELEAEPLLPVTLRNLDKEVKAKVIKMTGEGGGFFSNLFGKKIKITPENILIWLRKVHKAEREKSIFAGEVNTNNFTIPKPNGEKAFEVVGIPLKEPGFFVVEIESEKLGNSLLEKKGKMYVPTSALVTNMAVHFKWGAESSVVWVTSLDKGEPVNGAKISIRDCKNAVLAEGQTDASGIWKLGGIAQSKVPNCSYNSYDNGLLVIAEKDKDLSFVHSGWDNGIENWRFNLSGSSYEGNTIAHTVLDRTLLRAGETVHMKHILRSHSMKGLSYPVAPILPSKMKITHVGTNQEYSLNLKWNGGFSESEWKIPKQAKLGTYTITLFKGDKAYYTGEFKVEEFRVPLMKAIVKGPSEVLVRPKSFSVDLIVNYLSGGPAGGMAVKVKSWFRDTSIREFEGFEDYVFANGRLKEGTRKLASTRNYSDDEYEDQEGNANAGNPSIKSQDLSLDKLGAAKADIKDIPQKDSPQEVVTELEYRDPVGEIQTVSTTIPIYPGRYLVGLKSEGWAATKDGVKIFAAVVDNTGKPKAGVDVSIDLLGRKTITHRKRLVGGFYSYDSVEEVTKHTTFCKGKTDAKGLLVCKKESPITGEVIFQASIEDSAGNDVFAYREVYVTGKDSWFNVSDHDRMDIIPEKKVYESGETAKFQIRMPFKNATALVSVDREGVIDYYIKQISSANPTIEVPVKPNYAPNVFVSVLAVRGRVGEIKPTAMVDLGRPSYRFGIAAIKVGWKSHELKVSVKTDRPMFKIREKATVTINVKPADGSPLPVNSDVALVAVDEGLLELMPNNTWELLRAMMNERGLEVNTSTAQMQVVGRRHYGLKALPPGGGGGKDSSRELFDTLLLWKGSVKLNASGQAEVQVPLNDSLTRFKIIAIATGGEKYFGTGSTSIRTTQDLMLLPGLPQLAREGDLFNPSFTVRNATEKAMKVEVAGTVIGLPEKIEAKSISLEAGEAKEVSWSIKIPFGVEKLVYEFSAKSESGTMDKVKFTQKIVQAIPVRVQQGTLLQLENEYAMTVEKPSEALPGRGGVNVVYSKSLLESLTGIQDYMKKYPYTCLEQQTSKLIVSRDKQGWQNLMNALPSYLDSDGLAKFFPSSLYGNPTLTAYLLAISNEAGLEIPTDSKDFMLSGLGSFVEGTLYRESSLPTPDLTIRKLNAIEALARYGKAKPEHLTTLSIQPNLLPTSAVLDWWSILYKLQSIPKRNEHITQVEQILRSRLNLQGTTMKFTTEDNDSLWWLMVSSDQNAVRLLLNLVNLKKWKEDVPRIVRGAISRQRKGTWDITTANAWGFIAFDKFSKEYEKEPVAGESFGVLNEETKSTDWKTNPKGATLGFAWSESAKELKLSHKGTGKPWATIQSTAAVALKSPVSNGYTIEKTITPLEKRGILGFGGGIKRGDLVRVTLKIKADVDMTWVVVNDPIPTGASILGGGGLRDSASATMGEKKSGWSYPTFEERSFESYRAYYEYLPEGEMTIEYTIRLNQDGKFSLPATRVEAMYSPDMYGEYPNAVMEIEK